MNKLREAFSFRTRKAFEEVRNGGTSSEKQEASCDPGNGVVAARFGTPQTTVLLIDERQLTLECFASWLEAKIPDMSIATCASASEVADRPDLNTGNISLVLFNFGARLVSASMSADELGKINELLPNVPVLVISDHEETQQIVDALECGIRGYIPTSTAIAVVVGAIRLVQWGGVFVPVSAITAPLREQGLRLSVSSMPEKNAFGGFTNRQKQVLTCLREGKPNKLIAHELNMCESTVKVHVRHIMKKLGATNRTQVVFLTNNMIAFS
jgi:DNA-binding NarL/FixJ family response regulator